MNLIYLELIQLAITLIYSLVVQNGIAFGVCLAYSLVLASLPLKKYKPSKQTMNIVLIVSVFVGLSNRVYQQVTQTIGLSYTNLIEVLTITMLSTVFCFKKQQPIVMTIDKKVITIVYLFLLCSIPLEKDWQQQLVGIIILIVMCWIIKQKNKILNTLSIRFVKILLGIELGLIYFVRCGWIDKSILIADSKFQQFNIICFTGAIITGDLLLFQSFELPETDPIEIEMHELETRTITDGIHSPHQSEQYEPRVATQPLIKEYSQNEVDTQSYNIVFLIPFFLLPASVLQIPVYIYFFILQYQKPSKYILWAMYVAINGILIMQYEPSMKIFLVSLSMVCVMNWEISLQSGLSNLKALWLRWCFIIVLILLFWFALRKVNIFHLVLSIILLLFVTRGSQQGQRSFRNRNWKFLMLFFNLFLVLRYLYSISSIPDVELFQLLGISFNYNSEYLISDNFNFIPLLMSIAITLQYWTYGNKVYKTQSKQIVGNFVRNYRIFFKKLLTVTTIIYYKTIVWTAYIITIVLVLIQTFSVTSQMVLFWTLLMFLIQVSGGSKVLLHKMWRIMSILLSVLIIIRYFFQFIKFPTVYKIFSTIPMFSFLYDYQHLLGLSVDNPAQNYFHTITKFQLMIALDFIQLLLTYLVTDYYNIINKYHSKEQLDPLEKQKVEDTYVNFIAFKLQDMTRTITKVIRVTSQFYIKIFYLILGIYTALCPTIAQLLLVFVILSQYYKLNAIFYRLVAGTKILSRVTHKFRDWFKYCESRQSRSQQEIKQAKQLPGEIEQINADIFKQKIELHKKTRPYLVFAIITFILLLYSSRVLYQQSFKDFITEESLLEFKWYFYIFGTSVSRSQWQLSMATYVFVLIMVILEYKACQFVSSFVIVQQKPPYTIVTNLSNQQLIEKSIRANFLLGLNKIIQRSYVTSLIFISNMRSTPSSIFYLIMAFVLNTFGTASILVLSKIQILITYLQYCFMVFNFQNTYIYSSIPTQFKQFAKDQNPFQGLSEDWISYWTFGKNNLELAMYIVGIIVISSYQLYFRAMLWTSSKILDIISKRQAKLAGLKLFNAFKTVYTYIIVLCPLLISLTAMIIYLFDKNLTNILLLGVTGIFIFKQYVSQQIANPQRTRTFWKAYFRLFQILILAIMVLQCLLAIPQYNKYCVPLLCNQDKQLTNKIFESFLVLVFQLGIDILKSKQFERESNQWRKKFQGRAEILRLIVANYQNDLRLDVLKKDFEKRKQLKHNLNRLLQFLQKFKQDKTLRYEDRCTFIVPRQSLINIFLQYMPSLLDPPMMWDHHTAIEYLSQQNNVMIRLYEISHDKLKQLDNYYQKEFTEKYNDVQDLIQVINQKRTQFFADPINRQSCLQLESNANHVNIIPNYNSILQENIRRTIIQVRPDQQARNEIEYQEKMKMVEYMVVSAVVSNWQYITFIIMVLEHLYNNSLLTFLYPVIVFVFGMVQQYQADRLVWVVTYIYTLAFVFLKYSMKLDLLKMDDSLVSLIVGTNPTSFLLQFLLLIAIPIQTLLLQSIGLYKQSIHDIQSMKTCLIRNLLKFSSQEKEWRHQLETLLDNLPQTQSYGVFENIFGRSQLKTGIDYSFLLTTVQLICLIYSFLFYQKMFIQNDLSFYSMIEYNQFNGGMVVWMLLQLLLMLIDRFLSILEFHNKDWDISLIIKHIVLVASICILNYMFLFNTPSGGNTYTFVFGFIYSIYFLISALQVRNGINRISRGFMQRYTWYNGFMYMGFRAIPFVFEFKVFSDWFVTRTVMRLFDWIKFQDLFGRLFVAKCNALFLQGKVMGTKIEWWKKILMGLPLLLVIIILLFGPLVLFSTLNPLAEANPIIGGSVYISLSINNSNIYPLYINSHISKIYTPQINELSQNIRQVVNNYNIEKQCIQQVNLQSYSDSYWEISEGSQEKLLQEPQESAYQLIMTVKFTRKYTTTTPIYTLSNYPIPLQRVAEFKKTLAGEQSFLIQKMYNNALRLDNNNGLHVLTTSGTDVKMSAEMGKRSDKKYWIIEKGVGFTIVSDKYSEAIFGYSVVGFYISIILVVANYFRFIFQGSATTIWLTDIPVADPILTICEGIYLSRVEKELQQQDFLYWTLIDLVRSPDTVKLLTGNYLDARKQTLQEEAQHQYYTTETLVEKQNLKEKQKEDEKEEHNQQQPHLKRIDSKDHLKIQ